MAEEIPGQNLDDTSLAPINVREMQGSFLHDMNGEVIGKIGDVLVDAQNKPQWILVSYGIGLREDRIVPAFDLKRVATGYSVDYDKQRVDDAPIVSMTSMSDEDEQKLNAYWCQERQVLLPRACTVWGPQHQRKSA